MVKRQIVASVEHYKKLSSPLPAAVTSAPLYGAAYIFVTESMPDYFYDVLGLVDLEEKHWGNILFLQHSYRGRYSIAHADYKDGRRNSYITRVYTKPDIAAFAHDAVKNLVTEAVFVDSFLGAEEEAISPRSGESIPADDRLQIETAEEVLENFAYGNRVVQEVPFSLLNSDNELNYFYGNDSNFIGRECDVGWIDSSGHRASIMKGYIKSSEFNYDMMTFVVSAKKQVSEPSPFAGERTTTLVAEIEELLPDETILLPENLKDRQISYTIDEESTTEEAIAALLEGIQGYLFVDKEGTKRIKTIYDFNYVAGGEVIVRADQDINIRRGINEYATKVLLHFPNLQTPVESESIEAKEIYDQEIIKEITTSIFSSSAESDQRMADILMARYSGNQQIIEVTTTDDLSNISLFDIIFIDPTLNNFSFGGLIRARVFEIDRVINSLVAIEEEAV